MHEMFVMQDESKALEGINTRPQSQSAEDDWYKAGLEFQQGQTRFRT